MVLPIWPAHITRKAVRPQHAFVFQRKEEPPGSFWSPTELHSVSHWGPRDEVSTWYLTDPSFSSSSVHIEIPCGWRYDYYYHLNGTKHYHKTFPHPLDIFRRKCCKLRKGNAYKTLSRWILHHYIIYSYPKYFLSGDIHLLPLCKKYKSFKFFNLYLRWGLFLFFCCCFFAYGCPSYRIILYTHVSQYIFLTQGQFTPSGAFPLVSLVFRSRHAGTTWMGLNITRR